MTTDIKDYIDANPQQLTVVKLKQGISLFGGVLPSNVKKDELIRIYISSRQEYLVNNPSLSQINVLPKTMRLNVDSQDLTLGAFQITGVQQQNNQQFIQKLQNDQKIANPVVSPPKALKPKIQFEKTPQSIIHKTNIDSFFQSNVQVEQPKSTFELTNEFEKPMKMTQFKMDIDEDILKSFNQKNAEMVRSYDQKLVSPKLYSEQQKQFVEVQEAEKSCQNQNLGQKTSQRLPLKRTVHNPSPEAQIIEKEEEPNRFAFRKSLESNKLSATLLESRIAKKSVSTLCFAFVSLVLVFTFLSWLNVYKKSLIFPVQHFMKLQSMLLPDTPLQESRSFSLQKPVCPENAVCNGRNEIIKCKDPIFVMQKIQKTQFASDFWFLVKNKLVGFNGKIQNLLFNRNLETKYEHYKSYKCFENDKIKKSLQSLFLEMEKELLQLYGVEKCKLLKDIKEIENYQRKYDILELKTFQNSKLRELLKEKLTNDQNLIQELLLQSQSVNNFTIESKSDPTLSLLCKMKLQLKINSRKIVSIVFYTIVLVVFSLYCFVRYKLHQQTKYIHKRIKLHLQKVKQSELKGSSTNQFAIRSDFLREMFLKDYLFQNKMWKAIERRLDSDVQIDKLWVRNRNGEATDAYFFNGDGVVFVKRSRREEESRELSEHSLSY
uniref:Transmembrane domain-containing protein n=1 Tax=Trepomonas sp. PC1 TaxID=1076344 RepID=A0A146KE88_9EUKA|eukprot:JAP93985.1 Transmembrane domain-containing protein [Trepomonas sp. PC1]